MAPAKTPPRTPAIYALMLEIARAQVELPELESALKRANERSERARNEAYSASSDVERAKAKIATRQEALNVLLKAEPLNPEAQARMLRDALAEVQAAK